MVNVPGCIFRIVPSTAYMNMGSESSLTAVAAIRRYLGSLGFVEDATKEDGIGLAVIFPRHNDRLVYEDLERLRETTNTNGVLVLDLAQRLAVPHEKLTDSWLRIVRGVRVNSGELSDWIRSLEPTGDAQLRRTRKPTAFQTQVGKQLSGYQHRPEYVGIIKEHLLSPATIETIGSSTTPRLLSSDDITDFYYGLIRLGGKYGKIEHDLNTELEVQAMIAGEHQPVTGNSSRVYAHARIGELRQIRRFVDICQDILMAFRFPASKPSLAKGMVTVSPARTRNRILLIDDHPEKIWLQLENVINTFLPDYHLDVWRPGRGRGTGDSLRLQDVVEYNSLSSADGGVPTETEKERFFEVQSGAQGESLQLSPKRVLQECACILVDVLFDTGDGTEEEAGTRVIEGLSRMLHDFGGADSPGLPPIIALSRADDVTKVQNCLHAGASGYVLKSRLTALPAMVAKLCRPTTESPSDLHRNFRAVYRLPSETIGLLKGVRIPRHDFSGVHEPETERTKPAAYPAQTEVIAELLAAVPKTDLHVHVGSLMSPEFLAVAALITLLRHRGGSTGMTDIVKAAPLLERFWNSNISLTLSDEFVMSPTPFSFEYVFASDGIRNLAIKIRDVLYTGIRAGIIDPPEDEKRYRRFRSALHKVLGVRDHWDGVRAKKRIDEIPDIRLVAFALSHSRSTELDNAPLFKSDAQDKDNDVIQLFVLFLAKKCYSTKGSLPGIADLEQALFTLFSGVPENIWEKWRETYYDGRNHRPVGGSNLVQVSMLQGNDSRDILARHPVFRNSPLEFLLASGIGCASLVDYLRGCEYAGAEYLRHPYLIRLYAQQTVFRFVQLGVLYAEVRAAVSGYVSEGTGLSFEDVCRIFPQAFSEAQKILFQSLEKAKDTHVEKNQEYWLWKGPFSLGGEHSFISAAGGVWSKRFPCKVGIILTGKRHKSSQEMLREAAGAVVLQSQPPRDLFAAGRFAASAFKASHLVGFDLAGQEDDYPPERFRVEFEPLARLHIPITAHAGENAPAAYIERAVLDLRAARLGHGLALNENQQLLQRVREEGVCVELCPVSNFQTSRFAPDDKSRGLQRPYPLRELMQKGVSVCLNTDNPIISYTNIVKEFFQASFGYGNEGLSVWDALRLVRAGFIHSFMSLPERKAMLEIADQLLYDLFTDDSVVVTLRSLSAEQEVAVSSA